MKSVSRQVVVSSVVLLFIFLIPIHSFGQATERFDISVGRSMQKGPSDAPVTVIEFLDFQ